MGWKRKVQLELSYSLRDASNSTASTQIWDARKRSLRSSRTQMLNLQIGRGVKRCATDKSQKRESQEL